MTSLLALPREIRNQIISYIIRPHYSNPPDLDQNFEELVKTRRVLYSPVLDSQDRSVLYDPRGAITNTTNLVLVNHQLRAEVLESLSLLNLEKITYKLDVAILDEIVPLVTWLFVPRLSTKIDKLKVTIRLKGRYDWNKDTPTGPYSKFPHNCLLALIEQKILGPNIRWQMYSILERFIKAGPMGDVDADQEHRHIIIKTLAIDIVLPIHRRVHESSRPHEYDELDNDYYSMWACLCAAVRGTGFFDQSDWFSCGKVLFEHVGVIEMDLPTLRGERKTEVNVAELLRDMTGGDGEGLVGREELAEYKKMTWQRVGRGV